MRPDTEYRENYRLLNVGKLVGLQARNSANNPNTTSATIATTVIIGRLIAKSEITICLAPRLLLSALCPTATDTFTDRSRRDSLRCAEQQRVSGLHSPR